MLNKVIVLKSVLYGYISHKYFFIFFKGVSVYG